MTLDVVVSECYVFAAEIVDVHKFKQLVNGDPDKIYKLYGDLVVKGKGELNQRRLAALAAISKMSELSILFYIVARKTAQGRRLGRVVRGAVILACCLIGVLSACTNNDKLSEKRHMHELFPNEFEWFKGHKVGEILGMVSDSVHHVGFMDRDGTMSAF